MTAFDMLSCYTSLNLILPLFYVCRPQDVHVFKKVAKPHASWLS